MRSIQTLKFVLFIVTILPLATFGQTSSSLNTFSPYTMFGIGDLASPAPVALRAMGGAGVAYRSPLMINYMNPASASVMRRQTFLFNFGLGGQSSYSSSSTQETSYNTLNISDLAIQFPIYNKIGFTASMVPYSNIGYEMTDLREDEINKDGYTIYNHNGEGGITRYQFALGMEVLKHFSLGVQLDYYHGSLDRSFSSIYSPLVENGTYVTSAIDESRISKIGGTLGLQYSPIVNEKRLLTLGATYRFAVPLAMENTRVINTNNIYGDMLPTEPVKSDFVIPEELALGLSYMNSRFILNADYVFQGWGNHNSESAGTTVSGAVMGYVNTNSYKIGAEYVPKRGDVRSYFNRVSYRVGAKYGDYYMSYNGHAMDDKAITIGLGFPVKIAGTTNINFGAEFGSRGTTKNNMNKEKYIKFTLGLSLFGEDYWFVQPKYD